MELEKKDNKTEIITSLICDKILSEEELLQIINKSYQTNSEKEFNSINSQHNEILSDIYYLKSDYNEMLFNINIKYDIKYYIKNYDESKIHEMLKKFNLNIDILQKNYIELSSSEFRKILIIIGLLSESQTIIVDDPTLYLDNKSIQTLIKCLKIKKRENKTIIIISKKLDFLLEISDRIIIVKNKKVIKEGKKYEILSNEKLLNTIDLKTPKILEFINLVKNKNIKIGYRDNINDLIKDVFRYAR